MRNFLPLLAVLAVLVSFTFCQPSARGQDLSGVWRGKWTADATKRLPEHGGALRIKLQKTGPNTYKGRFSGRFALIIPYFYRADVIQHGNQIYSSKKLGPMGEYKMNLRSYGHSMSGSWNTKGYRGSIFVRRRR
ncbi:MAG: hypothetical protein AAF483_00130 [Planctomycetota bacterium]